MLGGTLVTKQTGPAGKPVNTLYVARKMALKREMYFAILLDRKTAGPVMIGCRWVGVCWESVVEGLKGSGPWPEGCSRVAGGGGRRRPAARR
jgi:succinyl-CoA synthetase beta subunit